MTNTPISGYPSGTPAEGTDETVIARSGANYKLTVDDVTTYVAANAAAGSTGEVQFNDGGALSSDALFTFQNTGSDQFFNVGDGDRSSGFNRLSNSSGLFTFASSVSNYYSEANITSANTQFGPSLYLYGEDLSSAPTKSQAVTIKLTPADGTQVDYTLKLPLTAGTANQSLITDGSGTLSWASRATLGANTFTGDQTISSGALTMSGNISAATWGTSGIRYKGVSATFTDTSAAGTVSTAYTNVYGGNTIAASNARTFTDYYTTFINEPTAGTNVTLTNKWALGLSGNLRVGGNATLVGGTITASAPVLDASQTWNSSGVTFTGLKLNVTDTASASSSLLMDLQVGGSSKAQILKDGTIYSVSGRLITGGSGSKTSTAIGIGSANTGIYANVSELLLSIGGSVASAVKTTYFVIPSTSYFGISSGSPDAAAADTILTRRAAANLRLGAADAAAPVAQTLSVQSVVAGTSNTAGANLTITGSQGTGTGAGGSIVFQVAPAGSSGTAQNALATALTINSSQQIVAAAAGSATTPSFAFVDTNWGSGFAGMFYAANGVGFCGAGGSYNASISNASLNLKNGIPLAWSSGTPSPGSSDLFVHRDAANTLALRNGTNAQRLNSYRSYTDGSNYSRLSLHWNTSTALVMAEGAGTGSDGSVAFNDATLSTSATVGFVMIPSCAGAPSGTPADIPTGQIPMVWDSTNLQLYVYTGGAWKASAAFT